MGKNSGDYGKELRLDLALSINQTSDLLDLKLKILLLISTAFILLLSACGEQPARLANIDATVEVEMENLRSEPPELTEVIKEVEVNVDVSLGDSTAGAAPTNTPTETATLSPPRATTKPEVETLSESEPERSGRHFERPTEEAPRLQNLLIKNLGPYDATNSTFGDLLYNEQFDKLVLDVFGVIHNEGKPDQYDNPTFEFKAPADTVVIVPVSGKLFNITWQPTATYLQDDWDILIRSSQRSQWAVNVDHIVSIDCDRSGKTPAKCDKPLRIDGQLAYEGMSVEAGQVLGYVGNWPDYNDAGINGRTELTVYKYFFEGDIPGPDTFIGVTNHCPTMHLAKEVEYDLQIAIKNLMSSYEIWSSKDSVYEQEKMVAPGCLYGAINEIDGKTEPIMD